MYNNIELRLRQRGWARLYRPISPDLYHASTKSRESHHPGNAIGNAEVFWIEIKPSLNTFSAQTDIFHYRRRSHFLCKPTINSIYSKWARDKFYKVSIATKSQPTVEQGSQNLSFFFNLGLTVSLRLCPLAVWTGASIPRKRPKKTRNPEKDPKKTEKDFIFNRILYYMILYPIWYYCLCLSMYPAYFDGRIHEINRNVAGPLALLILIVALFIDLAGVLNTVTVRGPDQMWYVIILLLL